MNRFSLSLELTTIDYKHRVHEAMPSAIWTLVKLILTVSVLASLAYGAKLLLDAVNDGIKSVLLQSYFESHLHWHWLTTITGKGRNN